MNTQTQVEEVEEGNKTTPDPARPAPPGRAEPVSPAGVSTFPPRSYKRGKYPIYRLLKESGLHYFTYTG